MACNNTLTLADANRLIASLKALGHPAIRVGGEVYALGSGPVGEGRSELITPDKAEQVFAAVEELEAIQEAAQESRSDED